MDGMRELPDYVQQFIQKLEQENKELREELQRIKKEFEEYKKRHPPNVGVKNGKPYAFKSSNQSATSKKPGAKQGHTPYFRPMPDHIDEVIKIHVVRCPKCGGTELSEKVQETRIRTYEDIPVQKSVVIQLQIERRYCRTCKKLVEIQVTSVLPKARLSLRVMLIVVWFKIRYRMTEEAIPEVLETLFGIHLSEGEVIHILNQVAKAFGPYYQELTQEIRTAEARNMDETFWRINGENANLWVFVNKAITLYKIAFSRSHEVPLEVLGKKHNGVDIHDRFSAYKTLAQKTKNPQQDCWTHILNNAEELKSFYREEGTHIHQELQAIYHTAKIYNHQGTDTDINNLFNHMKKKLNQPYKSTHCHRFVMNLFQEKDNLFEFVKNPCVDGTNNLAERAIRPPVVARKISGGNRSINGAHNYEVLLSVTQTLHQNGQNIIDHGPEILLTSHG